MNPRSRGVPAGSRAACSAAAAPLSSFGPTGPPANGLPQALIASPHCAMAQLESAASTAPKALSAASHQNECSAARACSNLGRAAWAQETGNATRPSVPNSPPWR
jgi:hypothetical protein